MVKSIVTFQYSSSSSSTTLQQQQQPNTQDLLCGNCPVYLFKKHLGREDATHVLNSPQVFRLTREERNKQSVQVMVSINYLSPKIIIHLSPLDSQDRLQKENVYPLYHSPSCPINPQVVSSNTLFSEDYYKEKKQSIRLASAVLVERKNHLGEREVLLTRRSKSLRLFPSVWVVPGGHVDPNETIEEAGRREILEETGIHLNPKNEMKLLCLYESIFPQNRLETPIHAQHIIFYFVAYIEESESKLKMEPNEVDLAIWLNKESVESLLFPSISKKESLEIEFEAENIQNEKIKISSSLIRNENLLEEHLSIGTQFLLHEWLQQLKHPTH